MSCRSINQKLVSTSGLRSLLGRRFINTWYSQCNWLLVCSWMLRNIHELKDVRAHCYCASLVRTLFIGHARATSFSSARTESKTQQNIELMTFALTWCANIFVGRSVTPTFFRQIASFSDSFHYTKKQKKPVLGKFQLFLIFFLKRVELVHGYRCA